MINLQLFAEGEEEIVEQENLEQEVDVENETEGSEHQEEKEDRVPLNKFLEEKKKRKELEKKMREFEAKEQDSKRQSAIEEIRKIALEKEFDEDTADMFTTLFEKTMSFQPKADPLTEQVNEDIAELAETSPDIFKYKKEITEKVKKFAKVGEELTVEEAYRLVAPQSLKMTEMQTDLEQKAALRRRESYENKQLNSSSKELKSKYQLDEADKKALAGLQKYQPNAGWNEEKYYKTMKG